MLKEFLYAEKKKPQLETGLQNGKSTSKNPIKVGKHSHTCTTSRGVKRQKHKIICIQNKYLMGTHYK